MMIRSQISTMIFSIFTSAFASIPCSAETTSFGIKHIVLCWLHEPGNPEHISQVVNTSRELSVIQEVIDIQAGTAVQSSRPIVDATFDVGVVMTFKSVDDMNTYLSHEEHINRVNRILRPLCQRIIVYDITY